MEKYKKGNKMSAQSRPMPEAKEAFTNKANGTLDYLQKQDKMASGDKKKLQRGGYKDNRYA